MKTIKILLVILASIVCGNAMAQNGALIAEADFTTATEFNGWTQFGDGQEGSVELLAGEGLAITVATQTGQIWQPQIMVIPDGSFNLAEDGNYKVVVNAKFPTEGTLQINMGSWSANDQYYFNVPASADFQKIECLFEGWSKNIEGCHLLFQCGDFLGTTILKRIEIYDLDASDQNPDPISYTLSIKASGNGSATYAGTTVRGKTSTFTVDEGTSATISFNPDNGYRIKSVKVNNTNVTSSVSNNKYIVNNISKNTSVEVEFEAIPEAILEPYAVLSQNNTVLTFYYDKQKTARGGMSVEPFTDESPWYNQREKITSVVFDTSFANCETITSTAIWFIDFVNLLTITGLKYLNTSNVTNMEGMFYNCSSLTSIDVSHFDTRNVTNMKSLFQLCSSLTSIDVSNFDTRNATTMDNMFNRCHALESLNLSSFNTAKVTDMDWMFCEDYNLETIYVGSGWDVSNVIDGKEMFWACNNLVGGAGTTYNPSHIDYDYAHIDGGKSNPGYLTNINAVTYILTVKATGNGSATYDGTAVKGKTSTFTVNEGTDVTIRFSPDNGYRIKSVKVNNTDVTSKVSNNTYTISNINKDTSVEVEFEEIPPTTYILSIAASGNGSATYDGTAVKGKTSTFTVTEGTDVTIRFSPDNGYRIKSVKVNSTDVTSSVSNNTYTISNISKDTSVEVEFEEIPPTTYTLSIKATGNGSVTYDGTAVKGKTSTFTLIEGTNVTISFSPDTGCRIKSVKVNNTDVTSSVSNNSYSFKISKDTSVEVEFEAIPPTTYTLSIKATGNGSVTYDGTAVKGKTSTFTVTEGTDVTIRFSPDNGYRIKSVKVNSTDVTSSLSNNTYTISNISKDISVEVEFEEIPPTTYTLSITASGNGSATYDGTAVRGKTSTFTIVEGSNATITFTSDSGNRIKSVKVNNSDVTSSVSDNTYTVNNISRNITIEVEFEVIPSTTYTMSITATGNGSASYEGTTIKNQTSTFTVNGGADATIAFTPDNGYRIKSVKVNNTDVKSKVSDNAYTVTNISGNVSVEVEFEAIPTTALSLTITATGNGTVTYDGTEIRGKTSTFSVNGGSSVSITFSPDGGNTMGSVKVNGTDVTSKVMNNSYTVSNISDNTTVEVVFEEITAELVSDGVYYEVKSESQHTVIVAGGNYGMSLEVPASFTAKNREWKVVGVEASVLDNSELAAIIWNPEVAFSGNVSNPNLLLYVKEKKFAPEDIKNVIVNGEAENIELVDAESGNNFYCPQAFTAKRISYIHRYSMKTGFKTCQGWETIVLPFDVNTILSATGTEIVPYAAWQQGSNSRPFWLYSMNENGWKPESGIKANVPYIISMPNNEEYDASYNLSGDIQFMSSNVQVLSSENMSAGVCGNKHLVQNYQNKVASQDIYVLNVNSQLNANTATEVDGSAFIRSLRQVRPFEAYMAIEGNAGARRVIPIFGDDAASIPSIPVSIDRRNDAIYNLNGQRVNTMSRGIYIQNGKKIIKK